MTYRTLHTHGTVDTEAAAIIKVDNQVVHSGPLVSGILFEFITDVSLHGKVRVDIELHYGEFTITHNRVTYPALIKGTKGFINMPQPVVQPNLPLTVNSSTTYNHYMVNGPTQWITDTDTDSRIIVVDDFLYAIKTMKLEFNYNSVPIELDKINDIIKGN